MTWSAEQQRMLEAMDLQPMQRVVAGQAFSATRGTAVAIAADPDQAPSAAAAGIAAGGNPRSAFRQALQRAAGAGDISALVDDLERLRREPALKRALWPRLRALRRSH